MRKKTIVLAVVFCLLLLEIFKPQYHLRLISLTEFSGKTIYASFNCPNNENNHFFMQFADERNNPNYHGVIQLYHNGTLITEKTFSKMAAYNFYNGRKRVGPIRYRIVPDTEKGEAGFWDQYLLPNMTYSVVVKCTEELPPTLLGFTCFEYVSLWERFWRGCKEYLAPAEKPRIIGNRLADLSITHIFSAA